MKMRGIIVETRHGTSLHAHDYASVGGSRREPVSITPNAIWGEAMAHHAQHVGDMRSL